MSRPAAPSSTIVPAPAGEAAHPPHPAAKLPVSCFIIAKNEADRLPRTIASVRDLVDEVVVVDSGSTDGTVEVASRLGARVIYNAWPGFGQQKRFAETQCRNDWLLNLDADEAVSPRLAAEMRGLFASGEPPRAVYGMPILVVYPGRTKPRLFANDHFCYRLYDRRRVRFADSTLFDSVERGSNPGGRLKGALHHFTVRSMGDLIAKCDERAIYNAAHASPKPRAVLGVRLITEFPLAFLKYYVARGHVFGGLVGFQFAMITAFYRFVRIVRMLEGQPSRASPELNAVRSSASGTPLRQGS
jgi:glycosyltransferase involved in cell wall biosynthesis